MAGGRLLLRGLGVGGLGAGGLGIGILALKALDAAGGVHQLLLAGEERVAVRADFDADPLTLDGGASLERMAAGAMNQHFVVVGVDPSFHSVYSIPVAGL